MEDPGFGICRLRKCSLILRNLVIGSDQQADIYAGQVQHLRMRLTAGNHLS